MPGVERLRCRTFIKQQTAGRRETVFSRVTLVQGEIFNANWTRSELRPVRLGAPDPRADRNSMRKRFVQAAIAVSASTFRVHPGTRPSTVLMPRGTKF